jgi:hypothetical protein
VPDRVTHPPQVRVFQPGGISEDQDVIRSVHERNIRAVAPQM